MASPFVKFEAFSEALAEKKHNLDTDTLKLYLTNVTPDVAADAVKADLAEISAGGGYTAGGEDTQNATSRSGGTTSVTGVDITWTASGGGIATFRYAVLYNDTASNDELIGYWDYGASIAPAAGETFETDFGSSMFTVT
jgi:hypothetical protein